MADATVLALTVAVASVAVYSYRTDFSRYSIFTHGVFRRVERDVIKLDGGECQEHECSSEPETAERRKWFKELVVAGMVVARVSGGEHYYCERHASFEVREQWGQPATSRTDKIAVGVAGFLAEMATFWDFEAPEDGEFSDAASSINSGVSDALALLPVAVMILIMATFIGFAKSLRGEL